MGIFLIKIMPPITKCLRGMSESSPMEGSRDRWFACYRAHSGCQYSDPMTLSGSIIMHMRYCLLWSACSVIVMSVKGASNIVRINHPASEVLSILERVLCHNFVLKKCLKGQKEEEIFKSSQASTSKLFDVVETQRVFPQTIFMNVHSPLPFSK